jgi:hypothetical protein
MRPPFTDEQFLDVFRRYNEAVAPMQWLLTLLGLVVVGAVLRGTARSARLAMALLGLLWLWMAVAYHLAFFATLSAAGYLFGALFGLQALLFVRLAADERPPLLRVGADARGIAATVLVLYALAGYPLAALALGHRFPAAPTFGLPCPTTVFTLGILLLATPLPRAALAVPAAWTLIGSTAALAFGMWEDVALAVAGLVALPLLFTRAIPHAAGPELPPAATRRASAPRGAMRVARFVLVTVLALLAPYLAYASATWLRYGHLAVAVTEGDGEAIDRYMPTYDVREVHETRVAAPAAASFAAACTVDLRESRAVRAVFDARALAMLHRVTRGQPAQPFLHEAMDIGWGMLSAAPGRELVFGAVTRPWEGDVHFRALPATEFAAFHEPGYAKIVWSITVEPDGPRNSRVRTETRVATTDVVSRARFRRYWALVSPGVSLIRYEALALLKRSAERPAVLARVPSPIALVPDAAP